MKQKHRYAFIFEELVDNVLLLFALIKRSKRDAIEPKGLRDD